MHAGNSSSADARARASPARARRVGLVCWIVTFAAIDFDARLLPWTLAVLGAMTAVEIALARWQRSLSVFVAAHLALAALACAHAAVCLAAFDLGLTLFAASIALAGCAALLVPRASRGTMALCCISAGTCALLAIAELAVPPEIAWAMPGAADPYERWSADLFEPDRELGWVMRANATVQDSAYLDPEHVEWSAIYHTDEDGGRAVPARPEQGPVLLLFGCSYTFGHGLWDGETIAAQVQSARRDWRVFNHGVLAYGTAQSWLAMKRSAQPIANEVVYVFIDDHLRRDSADRGWLRQFPREPIFEVDSTGGLQRIPVGVFGYVARRAGWSLWKRSIVFRRLDALAGNASTDERDVERAATIVDAMRADVRAKWGDACRFVVVFVPEAQERVMSARSREVLRHLTERGIECIDGFSRQVREGAFDRSTGHPRPAFAAEIAGWIHPSLDPPH
jgi:hypothetical protein